jgi:deoxyribonuclease-4
MRFGVHCSLRNGLSGALLEAKEKGCEAMQIFTRSPRMWKMRPPPDGEINKFKALRKKLNIFPLVVHIPYLPNLATSKKKLYALSLKALTDDLGLCERLGADYFVIHPGSFSEDSNMWKGIENIITGLNAAIKAIPGKSKILLETMAGGGRRIGSRFDEIEAIMGKVKDQKRIGVCLDTAHTFAAGSDFSTKAGIDKALKMIDLEIGLKNLKVIHFNDSLVPKGSKKDRHQHLGKGFIGVEGFQYLIKRLNGVAVAGILETPKEPGEADKRNLKLLFKWRDED